MEQLQRLEHQFTGVFVGLQGLGVAFAAAVDQISTALLEPVHKQMGAVRSSAAGAPAQRGR